MLTGRAANNWHLKYAENAQSTEKFRLSDGWLNKLTEPHERLKCNVISLPNGNGNRASLIKSLCPQMEALYIYRAQPETEMNVRPLAESLQKLIFPLFFQSKQMKFK